MALFDKPNPFGVSDAGNSIVAGDRPPLNMGDFPGVPKVRAGMFAAGSTGRNLLGYLGDALAQLGGVRGNFAPAVAQQRQQQFMAQQAQQKRMADYQDWVAQQQYKAANPAPLAPTEFDRALMASGIQPGTPQWTDAYKTKVQNTLDPWTNIVSGGESLSGRQSVVERALTGGGDPASSGGMPDWWSTFTPEEQAVIMRQGQGRMNRPSGSPLSGAANSKTVGGKQYWQINGKWYDNPEGR